MIVATSVAATFCAAQNPGVDSLADLVRRLRKRSGMSHGVLAARMGVHPGTIANLEAGRTTTLKSAAMLKLVEVFGDPVREWLEANADADADDAAIAAAADAGAQSELLRELWPLISAVPPDQRRAKLAAIRAAFAASDPALPLVDRLSPLPSRRSGAGEDGDAGGSLAKLGPDDAPKKPNTPAMGKAARRVPGSKGK